MVDNFHKTCDSTFSGVKWTMTKVKLFIDALMKLTLSEDVIDLKHLFILECTWKEVGKELNMDHKALKNFWNHRLHAQLFYCYPIYMNDIKIKLIEYIYGKGFTDFRQLKWKKIITKFDGLNKEFLYKIFYHLISVAKEKTDYTKLPDLIDYLYAFQIPHLINSPKDNILPRLVYVKDKIFYNEEDFKVISDYIDFQSDNN